MSDMRMQANFDDLDIKKSGYTSSTGPSDEEQLYGNFNPNLHHQENNLQASED